MNDRLSSGVKGLDRMLGGGFIPGTTVLVSGQAGSGKTTFAMQFLYDGARNGEHGLFITLEQDREKLIADMAAIGMNIPKAKNIRIIGGSLGDVMRFRKLVKAKLDDFLDEIQEVVCEAKAKRVAIDSINLFLMLFEGEEDKRFALLSLCDMLNKLGCTVMLTCETQENLALSWYGFEEFVVDDVITLMNVKMDHYFKHALSVRKMRGSAHDKSIVSYDITPKGLIVYPEDVVIPG
ncbi:MAG: ATPase domain-containing protein [Candidatus Aenigmatarchaeota archaeon]